MARNGLKVDLSLHRKLGMTIVTAKQAKEWDERLKAHKVKTEWPEDALFSPAGVTLEAAQAAMKLCRVTG